MPVSKVRAERIEYQGSEDRLSPVHQVGSLWLKRDDLWRGEAPAQGGKARTASNLCREARRRGVKEFCSAHDRNSSVPGMLARVCRHFGIGLHLWLPDAAAPLSTSFLQAAEAGAVLHPVRPGYMSVRQKRMRDYSTPLSPYTAILGVGLQWEDIGLKETAQQAANVQNLVDDHKIKRVVVPVGSGGMLRGVVAGLRGVPILGVCCGGYPQGEFPPHVELVKSSVDFNREVEATVCQDGWKFGPGTQPDRDVKLDPTYEAKCLEFLEEGDLLWVVAHRDTE